MSYLVSRQALGALAPGYSCPPGYPDYNDSKGLCYDTAGRQYKSPVQSASWGAVPKEPSWFEKFVQGFSAAVVPPPGAPPMAVPVQQAQPFYKSPLFIVGAIGALALVVYLARK